MDVISASPSGQWHTTIRDRPLESTSPDDFQAWSGLMQSAVSNDEEELAKYVKSRSVHNNKFFEDVRTHLNGVMQGLRVEMITAGDSAAETWNRVSHAHRALLQSLYTANGFLSNREQHKALAILEQCTDLADHLAARLGTEHNLFWQLLARMCLGNARAKFMRLAEAMEILEAGLQLAEATEQAQAQEQPGPKEKAVQGEIYLVMCRVQLDLALDAAASEAKAKTHLDEAAKAAARGTELLEQHLPQVPSSPAKRRDAAAALASAYASRGVCEVRAGQYEESFGWFAKGQDAIREFAAVPHTNGHRLYAEIEAQAEHSKYLHKFSKPIE